MKKQIIISLMIGLSLTSIAQPSFAMKGNRPGNTADQVSSLISSLGSLLVSLPTALRMFYSNTFQLFEGNDPCHYDSQLIYDPRDPQTWVPQGGISFDQNTGEPQLILDDTEEADLAQMPSEDRIIISEGEAKPLPMLPNERLFEIPTLTKDSMRFADFKKARRPQMCKEICTYQPSKRIVRQDVQPLPNESIPDFLVRVYNSYEPKVGFQRGFVFAGCDFFYGTHEIHPALNFLNHHMDVLKKIGIKKIFLEQILGFNFSPTDDEEGTPYGLYQYFAGFEDEMPKFHLPRSHAETCRMICEKAKAAGIEVIGAEVHADDMHDTKGFPACRRLRNFNQGAAWLVHTIHEPFVIFVGAAHGKTTREGPGLSELLDCPCVGLVGATLHESVKPGNLKYIIIEGDGFGVDAEFS